MGSDSGDGSSALTGQIDSDRFRITSAPLDPAALLSAVAGAGCGATTLFAGTVRETNADRSVRWLDYEAHVPLARRTLAQIGDEVSERWPSTRVAIAHRIGRIEIGEASVVIAAASAHRADAFAACRYAIERIKQIVPIWKHEHFEGGDVWIEGATADPDDPEARQAALARACG